MKRAIILGAVILAVVAGFVGQQVFGKDDEPTSPSSSLSSRMDAQAKAQAEQLAAALEEQKELAHTTANPHELVVTIRDELPLAVWDSTCHLLSPGAPALAVSEGLHRPISETALPSDARPLEGGGCEATVKVAVPDFDVYSVGVVFEGNGISDGTEPQPPLIKREGKSQKITIVE